MSSASAPTDPQLLEALRDTVRALCRDYPGSYWRGLDREKAYPTDFVQAMTRAGLLGVLIPE